MEHFLQEKKSENDQYAFSMHDGVKIFFFIDKYLVKITWNQRVTEYFIDIEQKNEKFSIIWK